MGSEACATHDVAGLRWSSCMTSCCTYEVGAEMVVPELACPLRPIMCAICCNYCKTAAMDGKAVHPGGTNTVKHHSDGDHTGKRCDEYSCAEGDVAVDS